MMRAMREWLALQLFCLGGLLIDMSYHVGGPRFVDGVSDTMHKVLNEKGFRREHKWT